MHAHDLLLGEDLPDGFQQLQGAVAVLLADLLHRRLLGAFRPFSPGRFRNAEQAAPIVAGSIEQLRRQGHGRKLREVGGPAGELAPALDEDGAVAVDQMLRLLFPGRLVERQPETAVLQGLGENFEPRESNAREGVELGGHPASVIRRDRPDDVGRPPTVAAVEDGEQVGAAVLVDDVVGLVDEQGRARRVDDAEDRRGRDRTGEDRVGREVLDTFEQG